MEVVAQEAGLQEDYFGIGVSWSRLLRWLAGRSGVSSRVTDKRTQPGIQDSLEQLAWQMTSDSLT